ncbi:MAG: stimulus-sensing domain-containing protein [Hyphomicrobiaceae bacterium]|nr:stimulus-sensing domain-containing protein [Hyphomicrobiaceae bacterium]
MALETERSERLAAGTLAGLRNLAGEGVGLLAALANGVLQGSRTTANGVTALAASAASEVSTHSRAAALGARALGAAALNPLRRWFYRQPLVRFVSASLLRRILVSNLIGFFVLLLGILYLGWYHTWLIDAKVDALKIQGKIIADAIASKAKVERERIVFDASELPGQRSSSRTYRDDGFAALELSISPEEVTPILRKLIQSTNTRARIYARDGTLIVDTARSLRRWRAALRNEPTENTGKAPSTQNFWTRLTRYLFDEPLPVYQEIGSANGTAYAEVRQALEGNERSMLLLNDKGEQIVSLAVPIRRFKTVQGVLLLSTRPGELDEILSEERSVILTLAAIALFASIVTSLLLARTVAGPMRRLSEAAEQASHNIAARTQLPEYANRSDEVGQMAAAFRAMTKALYRRIEASEKFAADVAHELKNPLTAARSIAESLSLAKNEEERRHLVEQIQNELNRLNRLITDVSNASRLDAELARQEMRPVDITTVLRGVVTIFRDILGDDQRQVRLVIEDAPLEEAYIVNGDEGRIGQVLTNLVDNAISFSPKTGTITVRARSTPPHMEIYVEDEGPGIPEDRLEVIFDRFYTDRPDTEAEEGKNSGLGLSISREIIRAHGGQISAESRFEDGSGPDDAPLGARFAVKLPLAGQTQRGGGLVGRRR